MADFGSFDSVAAWVAEKGANGVQDLRVAVDIGLIQSTSAKVAQAWLDKRDRDEEAAERGASLQAAKDAAEASQKSAFWTMVAAWAAAAGAIATALQAFIGK